MAREIRRNVWARFCRKFSLENQYRYVSVSVEDNNKRNNEVVIDAPLIGLALEKKGRLIDGLQIYSVWDSHDEVINPVLTVKQPAKVILDMDDQGKDKRLTIQSREGRLATIELRGEKDVQKQRTLVEKVAYRIFEQRGGTNGSDMQDWLEAERKVREAESNFV